MKIDPTTKLFGLVGYPIKHSLSPLLHNWMIDKFGLNACYLAFRIPPASVREAIAAMQILNIRGFNVTIPLKEKIVNLIEFKAREVELIGAANTIKNEHGSLSAHVTDPYGFLESVERHRDRLEHADVLLLGAGGSARSVVLALAKLDIRHLMIANRTDSRAEELARLAKEKLEIPQVTVFSMSKNVLNDAISQAAVIINATPMGMSPAVDRSPLEEYAAIDRRHFVYDLIYNPKTTLLLKKAAGKGATIQNGMDMLIYQALASQRIWWNEHFELDTASLDEISNLLNSKLAY